MNILSELGIVYALLGAAVAVLFAAADQRSVWGLPVRRLPVL